MIFSKLYDGQPRRCLYVDLVMQDNVDTDVLKALKNKEDFSIEIYAQNKMASLPR